VWAVISSLVLAVAGVFATRAGVAPLARTGGRDPHVYWSLGLASLLPAWVVVFLSLLGGAPRVRFDAVTGAAWILSAAAALAGAIATERRVRDGIDADDVDALGPDARPGSVPSEEVRSPERCWWFGVLAFVPAWAIAVLGHLLGRATG
jgi:hypothetical protein